MRNRFLKRMVTAAVAITAVAGALGAGCSGSGGGGGGGGPMDPGEICGPYPAQATSPYVLPYPVGSGYLVSQGNCSGRSHSTGFNRYATDFLMPIGSRVAAARGGVVDEVEESFPDGTRRAGEDNVVIVDQGDGTFAAYVHLTQNGALVEVGDAVAQGQVIALSGDSGNSTQPHLHFAVLVPGGTSEPVSFRNTIPNPQGPVAGTVYVAQPY